MRLILLTSFTLVLSLVSCNQFDQSQAVVSPKTAAVAVSYEDEEFGAVDASDSDEENPNGRAASSNATVYFYGRNDDPLRTFRVKAWYMGTTAPVSIADTASVLKTKAQKKGRVLDFTKKSVYSKSASMKVGYWYVTLMDYNHTPLLAEVKAGKQTMIVLNTIGDSEGVYQQPQGMGSLRVQLSKNTFSDNQAKAEVYYTPQNSILFPFAAVELKQTVKVPAGSRLFGYYVPGLEDIEYKTLTVLPNKVTVVKITVP